MENITHTHTQLIMSDWIISTKCDNSGDC